MKVWDAEIEAAWRREVRRCEFAAVRSVLKLKPGLHVLDLGAGDGFLAALIAESGARVTATDPKPRRPFSFPVRRTPPGKLPFADGSFDRVFTSNVLEHVEDLQGLLAESRRVLESGGFMVHTVPTSLWRVLTILTQPLAALRYAARAAGRRFRLRSGRLAVRAVCPAPFASTELLTQVRAALSLLWPAAHGASPSAWHEVLEFTDAAWRRRFRRAGLTVADVLDLPMLHSGHALFPGMAKRVRLALSRAGLAACRAYVVRLSAPSRSPRQECH